jgi:hypothetical protein
MPAQASHCAFAACQRRRLKHNAFVFASSRNALCLCCLPADADDKARCVPIIIPRLVGTHCACAPSIGLQPSSRIALCFCCMPAQTSEARCFLIRAAGTHCALSSPCASDDASIVRIVLVMAFLRKAAAPFAPGKCSESPNAQRVQRWRYCGAARRRTTTQFLSRILAVLSELRIFIGQTFRRSRL